MCAYFKKNLACLSQIPSLFQVAKYLDNFPIFMSITEVNLLMVFEFACKSVLTMNFQIAVCKAVRKDKQFIQFNDI